MLAGRGVEDVLADERLHLTWQVGVERLFEHRRNVPARFDFALAHWRRARRVQVVVAAGSRFARAIEERLFPILHVLRAVLLGLW